MAARDPVDLALDGLRSELARAERAAEAASRTKQTCDERVDRLRSTISVVERALAEAEEPAPAERSAPDNIVGLTSVPKRERGTDLGRAMGGFSEQRPMTVSDRILAVLDGGGEMGAMEIASLAGGLGTATVQSTLSQLVKAGRCERSARGRYRKLAAAS